MQKKVITCYRADLPKFLRELRLQANLSQNDVAHVLEKHRSSYTYYESGKAIPNVEILIRLCGLYKVGLYIFFDPSLKAHFTR